jgi:hypothetical protein
MAIDLKELLIAAQNKIGNSTSSTATRDLVFLAKTATRGDTSIVAFDSDGEFLDSASHVHRIAYHRGRQNLFLLDSDRTWKPISGTVPSGYSFQGSTSGYTSGGGIPITNIIDKFPFSSDGNATDVGDLTTYGWTRVGQSSSDNGYVSSGTGSPDYTTIEKFPFATDANATDVGDLTVGVWSSSGQSSSSNGYVSGGQEPPQTPTHTNVIQKFPFSVDANSTDVGDLTVARFYVTGQSSDVSGYTSGGGTPSGSNVIDKFPFSSDANATDVGDLTQARSAAAGQSSSASGYTSGGALDFNIIDKFPFSSDGNATDVGDLTVGRGYISAGQSSTASGYNSGGQIPPASPNTTNVIDKFPFSSDANATDVGDLTLARRAAAGNQV